VNNPRGSKEGQKIPEVKNMMFKKTDRWNPKNKFDWKYIKKYGIDTGIRVNQFY
jgi:hypothetical protein